MLKDEINEDNIRLIILKQFRKYLEMNCVLSEQNSIVVHPSIIKDSCPQTTRMFHPSLFEAKISKPEKPLRTVTNRNLNEAVSFNDYNESAGNVENIKRSVILNSP